ncbi:hypothetical protein EGW08_019808, partial [Elysia chlorotica]
EHIVEVAHHINTDLRAVRLPLDVDGSVALRQAHACYTAERLHHVKVLQLHVCHVGSVFSHKDVAGRLHDDRLFESLPLAVGYLKLQTRLSSQDLRQPHFEVGRGPEREPFLEAHRHLCSPRLLKPKVVRLLVRGVVFEHCVDSD